MDGLLRYLLDQFIRHGTIRFTAKGLHLPAATEPDPVSVRILTNAPNAGSSSIPNLRWAKPIWTAVRRRKRRIAEALEILFDQPEIVPGWAKVRWWCAISAGTSGSSICVAARKTTSPIITISTAALFPVPRRRPAIQLRLFRNAGHNLDDAQGLVKKRHIAAKLLVGAGDRVLDIGSGWGGLGLYLAEMTGADVTGITLSSEQLQASNAQAAEKNLTGSAKFLLSDYRRHGGQFDRIVSVGMFEHVGVDHLREIFPPMRRAPQR